MSRLRFDISMSLDGYVAGPNASVDVPLGEGGEQLHEWVLRLASWRSPHGLEGGETGPDDALFQESIEATGAVLMGRKMFSGGEGPWEGDSNRDGWWGDDPPFRKPVFVLTHHARETVTYANGTSFTFVTDGIESALQQARAAAGDRAVSIGGGADVAQQYLAAGLIDEIELHVVPVLLGDGVRLFGGTRAEPAKLEPTRVVDTPAVTHLRYRVVR
jgi:dihydrofolate reductase